ncbi:hypothetical protein VEE13_46160 (plasmid) [Escherichia coli]|nr:ppfA [Shigella flexneri]BEA23965.1 hypothetical protein VEE13_46160 [Escherichia coli]BEA33424.1 hypothetical protein VEE09_44970 [Escherichia coli]HCN9813844.1 ppfA [Escherichia coli]
MPENPASYRVVRTKSYLFNKAHFHSQEVKNESEQAKYADRQMERKAEVQKQLVAAGNVRQRIPADTQRLLRESISEFNADADKG